MICAALCLRMWVLAVLSLQQGWRGGRSGWRRIHGLAPGMVAGCVPGAWGLPMDGSFRRMALFPAVGGMFQLSMFSAAMRSIHQLNF